MLSNNIITLILTLMSSPSERMIRCFKIMIMKFCKTLDTKMHLIMILVEISSQKCHTPNHMNPNHIFLTYINLKLILTRISNQIINSHKFLTITTIIAISITICLLNQNKLKYLKIKDSHIKLSNSTMMTKN